MTQRPDIDAIEARAAKATGGSWSVHEGLDYVRIESPVQVVLEFSAYGAEAMEGPEPDWAFIAPARTDIPSLYTYVRELEARLAWRPIETAPRDGSSVLLFTTIHGEIEARFEKGSWCEATPDHPREYTGSLWVCGDDVYEIMVEETPDGYDDGEATYWMPLPEPPEAK